MLTTSPRDDTYRLLLTLRMPRSLEDQAPLISTSDRLIYTRELGDVSVSLLCLEIFSSRRRRTSSHRTDTEQGVFK